MCPVTWFALSDPEFQKRQTDNLNQITSTSNKYDIMIKKWKWTTAFENMWVIFKYLLILIPNIISH